MAARARRASCSASGSASAGSTSSGWTEPQPPRGRRRRRRERAADDRRRRRRCTASSTSAGTAGRRSCRSTRTPASPRRAAPSRCAAPITRGPTAWTAGCCGRRTPRTSTTSTRRRSGCRRSASTRWGGFVFVHLSPDGEPDLPTSLGAVPERLVRYPLDRLVVGRAHRLRGAGQLEGHRRELQRVLPLRRRASRAGAAGAGVRPRWRRTWTGTAACRCARGPGRSRRPAPRTAGRSPGLDADEQVRHKGELVYPNLMISLSADHVAAFVAGADARPAGRTIVCDILVDPGRARPRRLRPVRRGGLLGHGQPAGLGDLRVGAARDVLARLHAGLVRADGGRRAWTSGAGCCPGWSGRERARRSVEVEYVVVGLGALGSAAAWQLARRGASRRRARAVRARPRPRAPRTTPRGSSGTAITRPAYVDLTFAAYDDWADLESASGEPFVTITGGVDLFPPDAAIPIDDYTSSHGRLRRAVRRARRRPRRRDALAAVRACRPAPRCCTRPAPASSRPRAARPPCSGWPSPRAPRCSASRR